MKKVNIENNMHIKHETSSRGNHMVIQFLYFRKWALLALALVGVFIPYTAFAICPTGASPMAAQAAYDIAQRRKSATDLAPDIIKLADMCPDNAIVQLYSTEVLLRMPVQKSSHVHYQTMSRAWDSLQAYSKTGGIKNGTMVMVDSGPFIINTENSKKMQEVILQWLMLYDVNGVGTHPYLLEAEFNPSQCPPTALSQSSTIAAWIRQRGPQDDGKKTGARTLLDKLVAACAHEKKALFRGPLADRAIILMAESERQTNVKKALALAKQAQVDSQMFLGGQKTAISWQEWDAEKLAKLLIKVGADYDTHISKPTLAREVWFKPENLGSEDVISAIAFTIETKWALQVNAGTDGYTATIGAVTKEMGLIYAMAANSDHIKEAKAMMYTAFQRHAQGRYRSPTTKSLKPIPDFMWSWLKPEEAP